MIPNADPHFLWRRCRPGSSRTVVTLNSIETGQEFDVIIYGPKAEMESAILHLAARYPGHELFTFDDAQLPVTYRFSQPPAPEPAWYETLAATLQQQAAMAGISRRYGKVR